LSVCQDSYVLIYVLFLDSPFPLLRLKGTGTIKCELPGILSSEARAMLGHKVPSKYTKEEQLKVYMSKKEYNKQTVFNKLKEKYDYRLKK